jgi:hypothetical protein
MTRIDGINTLLAINTFLAINTSATGLSPLYVPGYRFLVVTIALADASDVITWPGLTSSYSLSRRHGVILTGWEPVNITR